MSINLDPCNKFTKPNKPKTEIPDSGNLMSRTVCLSNNLTEKARSAKDYLLSLHQPSKAISSYTVDPLKSVGQSLFSLGSKCFNAAKESLLTGAEHFSTWAYNGLKDLPPVFYAKTPFEIDYLHDKGACLGLFFSAMEELKTITSPSSADQERLRNFGQLIWHGLITPFQYENGIKELEASWPSTILSSIRAPFYNSLRGTPFIVEAGFQNDLIDSLRQMEEPANQTGNSSADIQNFKEILTFYLQRIIPFDYRLTLKNLRSHLQKNKPNTFTVKTYREVIAALNEALSKNNTPADKDAANEVKRLRIIFNQAAQELPFYSAEIAPQGIWSDVKWYIDTTPLKDRTVWQINFTSLAKTIGRTCEKSISHAVQHPWLTFVAVLATQVAVVAAFNAFKGPEEEEVQRSINFKRSLDNEFPVNERPIPPGSRQPFPSVITFDDGTTFAAWGSSETGNYDIYGSFLSPNGTITNQFRINQVPNGDQWYPIVIPLGNQIVVGYHGNQYGFYNVFARILNKDGTFATPEFPINQNAGANFFLNFLAPLPNGNFFASWQGDPGGDIHGNVLTPGGIPLNSSDVLISETTTGDQGSSFINVLANGDIQVTWHSNHAGNYNVYTRKFDSSGAPKTPQSRVNQNITGDQTFPSSTTVDNDESFVTWSGNQEGNLNIYGRHLFASNATSPNEFNIYRNPIGSRMWSNSRGLLNGNIFVLWTSTHEGPLNAYGSLIAPNGTVLINMFKLNEITTGLGYFPSIASSILGDIFLAWSASYQANYNVYVRKLPANFLGITPPSRTTGAAGTTAASSTGTPSSTGALLTSSTVPAGSTGVPSTVPASSTGIPSTAPASSTGIPPTIVSSSGEGTSTALIIELTLGIGVPTLCIIFGVIGIRKYFSNRTNTSLNFDSESTAIELRPPSFSSFEPSAEGFSQRYLVTGTLHNIPFVLRPTITKKEAQQLEQKLYHKIAFVADSSNGEMFHRLGKGSFGETFVAINLQKKNELVAVKKVVGDAKIKESLNEAKKLYKVKGSPYIISLDDYLHFDPQLNPQIEVDSNQPSSPLSEACLFQFMPLAVINGLDYKDLMAFLKKKNPKLYESLLTIHSYQLLTGLAYAHSKAVYHMDLKDENLLFMGDFTLKIADFGRSLDDEDLGKGGRIKDIKYGLGDKRKYPPEAYAFIRHAKNIKNIDSTPVTSISAASVDMWYAGLFLLETICGRDIFGDLSQFEEKAKWTNNSFQNVLNKVTELHDASKKNLAGLIQELLQVDPKDRITAESALEWPLFKKKPKMSAEEGTNTLKKLMEEFNSSQNTPPYIYNPQNDNISYYN